LFFAYGDALRRKFVVVMPFDVFKEDASLVKRIVVSAMFTSHDIRRDVSLVFILHGINVKVSVSGEKAKHIHVDEPSYMGIHRRVVSAVEEAKASGLKKFPHWGFVVEKVKNTGAEMGGGYLVATRGKEITEVLRSIEDEITLIFSHSVHVDGVESVKISSLKKPVDVLIALANILLDSYSY